MTKAFLAVEGGNAAASGRVHDLVQELTDQLTDALKRRNPAGGTVHIEDIQDQVELALMRSGEHKVARAYVLYREEQNRKRAEEAATRDEAEATAETASIGRRSADAAARVESLAAAHATVEAPPLETPEMSVPEGPVVKPDLMTVEDAKALGIVGLMNVQYAIFDNTVYVLEANPRASRTVPLVSKVCGLSMARLATQVILGRPIRELNLSPRDPEHYGVKEAVFPFNMYHEVDPLLGPEMRSEFFDLVVTERL